MAYNEIIDDMENYKSTMTFAERMKKYMAGEKVDHIPFNIMGDPLTLSGVYGYTTQQVRDDFEIFADVVEKARSDHYLDGVSFGIGLRTLGAAMGSTLHYPENGIDNIETYFLESYDNWDKMRDPNPYDNPILTPMLERAKQTKVRFPDLPITTGVVGPISAAVSLRPIEKALKDTRKKPEKLKELLGLVTDQMLRWVEIFIKEIGPTSASVGDPVTCDDILSTRQFEEFNLPELKRLINGIEELTGSKPSLHICGHTKNLWPYFKNLGISSFSVDNCEDIGELKRVIGDDLMVVGNVPPVDIIWNGTPEDIVESVKDCIAKAGDSPCGYILSAGCGLPINSPKENLDTFVYAARKYGAGAQMGKMPEGMME